MAGIAPAGLADSHKFNQDAHMTLGMDPRRADKSGENPPKYQTDKGGIAAITGQNRQQTTSPKPPKKNMFAAKDLDRSKGDQRSATSKKSRKLTVNNSGALQKFLTNDSKDQDLKALGQHGSPSHGGRSAGNASF